SYTEHYESNEGRQLFDTKRSFIHEVVHGLLDDFLLYPEDGSVHVQLHE
ncbi:PipA/GogA/GtgA family type III secretion system effector, partial [Salmonella enterica]